MLRAVNRRRVLDFLSGARRPRPSRRDDVEVVSFEGRITIEPPDDYGQGNVTLVTDDSYVNLVSYLYKQLEVPREDGVLPHVSLRGRIVLEVHPDPDARWLLG